MLRVFVLEDEEYSRSALTQMLQNISEEITVSTAADLASARLLLGSAVSFDLFLLDVNLDASQADDISGICLAEEIRRDRRYAFTPIVMVTSVAGMEMEAYRSIHCYQYIVKPYEEAAIREIVQRILSHKQAEEKPSLIVKKNGINYNISCGEIVFGKAIPRGVCLYLKGEQIDVPYLTIRQLTERLPKEQFFQCHRMYVVNKDYVRYYDLVNQLIEVDGYSEQIDIGITFKPEVKRLIQKG